MPNNCRGKITLRSKPEGNKNIGDFQVIVIESKECEIF